MSMNNKNRGALSLVWLLLICSTTLQSAELSNVMLNIEEELKKRADFPKAASQSVALTMVDKKAVQYLTPEMILDLLTNKKFKFLQDELIKNKAIAVKKYSFLSTVENKELTGDTEAIGSKVSSENVYEVTGGDHEINIKYAQTKVPVRVIKSHTAEVKQIALSVDENYVAAVFSDNRVCVWEIVTGRLLLTRPFVFVDIDSLIFSPDGTYLAVILKSEVIVINIMTRACFKGYTRDIPYEKDHVNDGSAEVQFSPDSKFFAFKFKNNMQRNVLFILDCKQFMHVFDCEDYKGDFDLLFKLKNNLLIGFRGDIIKKIDLTMTLKDYYLKWLKHELPEKYVACEMLLLDKAQQEKEITYQLYVKNLVKKAATAVAATAVGLYGIYYAYQTMNNEK